MNNEKWKQNIYEPYLKTWKILKLIQYADQTSDSDEQWQRYKDEVDRLNEDYKSNAFVQDNLIPMLFNAADTIARENQGEPK